MRHEFYTVLTVCTTNSIVTVHHGAEINGVTNKVSHVLSGVTITVGTRGLVEVCHLPSCMVRGAECPQFPSVRILLGVVPIWAKGIKIEDIVNENRHVLSGARTQRGV